jgi:ubiquinone/menaquinone biosynthesis C-methylase UbiE
MWFEKVRLDEACSAVSATLRMRGATLRMREAETSGDRRDSSMDYDAELRLLNQVLRRAYALRQDDDVLDIGCGTGETTREAARAAAGGSVVGVDISAAMIDRGRELTKADGLHNVTFVHGDAQTHRFPSGSFDVAISRFGTMFFNDPLAAFTNIAQALRRDGRLVMMVWQAHERNEWSVEIEQSLAGGEEVRRRAEAELDPFSLADPGTVVRTLEAAGFADVTFTDVHEPVYYGPDVATALEWVGGFARTNEMLTSLDPVSSQRALERLRETLVAHAGGDGVWFDSQAWIVAARRR